MMKVFFVVVLACSFHKVPIELFKFDLLYLKTFYNYLKTKLKQDGFILQDQV